LRHTNPRNMEIGKPAVFMDRDGTIIYDKGFMKTPDEIELLPMAGEAIRMLNESGFFVAVLSNQSGINRGIMTEEDVEKTNKRVIELLNKKGAKIDFITYCPSTPEEDLPCRKPNIGMVEEVKKKFDIDISKSFVVGDKSSDIELAKNIGATPILVLTGYGEKTVKEINSGIVAPDLFHAVKKILLFEK